MGQVKLSVMTDRGYIVERESDFDCAVSVMDDDVREDVHSDLAPCTEQEFMDDYCKRHEAKFGTMFMVP
jgi:hypothetical protein